MQTIIATKDDSSDSEDEEQLEEKKAARKWDHDSTTKECHECRVKFTTTNRRVCRPQPYPESDKLRSLINASLALWLSLSGCCVVAPLP
jgi:hypothetical protein